MTNEIKSSAQQALKFSITTGSDISSFFTQKTGSDFIDWFNDSCANKEAWTGRNLAQSKQLSTNN